MQMLGARCNIKCSACRNVCTSIRLRANLGSRLVHFHERNGRWTPGFYIEDPRPYNVPGTRQGRYVRVAGHFLTRDNGNRNVYFFNQCLQIEVEKNIHFG